VQYKGKYVNNATSTKQPVNAATGVVVLASSGGTDRFYYHAEMAVGGGGAMDTQAPSVPAGLTGQATSSSSVGLSWSASTDNVGVVGYRVFRDGVLVGSPTSTSYTDSSLTAGTSYSYAVAAVDAANNVSARSAPVSVTTPAAPPASAGITFKGASAQANDTATSLSIASPPGASAGDVMLASVAVRGAPTITAPAGWTLVRLDAHATTMRQATYVKVAAATEPTSYTWSFSSAQGAAGTVQAYSGVSQTQPVETSGGQLNEASTALTAPGVVATAGNLQVGLFSAATLTSVTPPVGMTERAEAATSAGRYKVTSEAADALTSTTGDTGAITAQASASAKSVGQVVILRAG
jgi:chitodextrinase